MAMTPEAKVKAECIKVLNEVGAYYFAPAANGYGRAGIPDLIACHNGWFVGIECKAGKNKTSALQDRELEAIKTAKGHSLVVTEHNVQVLRLLLITLGESRGNNNG